MSGETKKYLDGEGLSVLWNKVKAGDNAVAAGAAEDLQSAVTTINTSIGAINTRLNGGDPVYAAVRDGSGNTITETYIPNSNKGVANGVATLDSNGKVPSTQLPSYVDDVVEAYYYNGSFYEEDTHTTLITPETGKIYVDLSTNKEYRWGGSAYAEISASLAIGTTAGTAFEGSRGYAIEQNYVPKETYGTGVGLIDTCGKIENSGGYVTATCHDEDLTVPSSDIKHTQLSLTPNYEVLKSYFIDRDASTNNKKAEISVSRYGHITLQVSRGADYTTPSSIPTATSTLYLDLNSFTYNDSKVVTESDTLTENEINAICV